MRVFVLMRHQWRGDWGDYVCEPVGVYADLQAAVAAAASTGFADDEDIDMYTVEFEIGAEVDVDAMGKRGQAV